MEDQKQKEKKYLKEIKKASNSIRAKYNELQSHIKAENQSRKRTLAALETPAKIARQSSGEENNDDDESDTATENSDEEIKDFNVPETESDDNDEKEVPELGNCEAYQDFINNLK